MTNEPCLLLRPLSKVNVPVIIFVAAMMVWSPAFAQGLAPGSSVPQSEFGARKIFFMLFLMLGPIKILVPFVNMSRKADSSFRRRLATRAVLFSAAALAIAVLLGRSMLENFEISVPVLAMTGGIVLFLVALRTVLQQSSGSVERPKEDEQPADLSHALTPLAFPIIVTPYGVAAVIVFATLAEQYSSQFAVGAIVALILLLDWLAMLFAESILRWVGTSLQVFAVVLGVTQIALGLQVILHSLCMVGVIAGCRN
ncbi:multiple antibiotic resistance protein [Mesorhizobium soli]|uniref:MarC family protein n=1 Tax=Pseudaminobacter soli (ex Li et al. 2025) TaxID=1295366 RepID=UPI0024746A5C|nr:MarC family protein [Mesorhizobium soli]MDH6234500.1 multiple antibiotic resistance protein [Mesorhizobium soli]